MKAGTITPPSAATPGNIACETVASSPRRNSRFNSKPTNRKNKVIKPSFTQNEETIANALYRAATGELAKMSAIVAAENNNKLLDDSNRKKRCKSRIGIDNYLPLKKIILSKIEIGSIHCRCHKTKKSFML